MPMPTTEPAAPRPAPPPLADAPREPEPCPNRATCTSRTCKRAWAFAPSPETEH